jgi:hypothetical protein
MPKSVFQKSFYAETNGALVFSWLRFPFSFSFFLLSTPFFTLSSFTMITTEDLKASISETNALKFDFSVLAVLEEPPPNREAFALIGKVLSLKPFNTQVVRHTLAVSWSFAVPIAVETLAQNKFLLGVSDPAHVDTILSQGPRNIRGSLLLLKLWSPTHRSCHS